MWCCSIFDLYYPENVLIFTGQLKDTKDENLYSGFGTEEVAPALQTEDLEYDEGFQVGYEVITKPWLKSIKYISLKVSW